jgi:hypothetical protein
MRQEMGGPLLGATRKSWKETPLIRISFLGLVTFAQRTWLAEAEARRLCEEQVPDWV